MDNTEDNTDTTPLTTPEEMTPLGSRRVEDTSPSIPSRRVLVRVHVISGSGWWGYWASTNYGVIADSICNPHAFHFAGRFEEYQVEGTGNNPAWLIIEGWTPINEVKIYVEDEDEGLPRWERRETAKND